MAQELFESDLNGGGESISIRNLPTGTKGELMKLAKDNERSLESEIRHSLKLHLERMHNSELTPTEELPMSEAKRIYVGASARRDSVARKLGYGSESVDQALLDQWNKKVDEAFANLSLDEMLSLDKCHCGGDIVSPTRFGMTEKSRACSKCGNRYEAQNQRGTAQF